MSPQDSTLLLASAKINLALQVTGLKDDGYHLLSSLVACVNFGDEITIIPSAEPYNPSNDLTIAGEFVGNIGAEKNNLITRAIELCQAASGQQFCGKVMLEKKIPIGGGLGGGTSDGIAMLRYLAKQWQLDAATQKKIAEKIGADGPAILFAKPCLVSGIGDAISPVPLPADLYTCHLLLVSSGVFVSTRDVFAKRSAINSKWDAPFSLSNVASQNASPMPSIDNIMTWRNGLEDAACKLYPALSLVKKSILQNKGCLLSNMTGSGGCFYGLFDNQTHAEQALHHLRQQHFWAIQVKIKAQ